MVAKFDLRNWKHPCIVWCKVYVDTLSPLGVTHECDRRTDGRKSRLDDSKCRAPLCCAAKEKGSQFVYATDKDV